MKLRNLSVSVLCLASVFCFANAEASTYIGHISNETTSSLKYGYSDIHAGQTTQPTASAITTNNDNDHESCISSKTGACVIRFVDTGKRCTIGTKSGFYIQSYNLLNKKGQKLCVTTYSGANHFFDVALSGKVDNNVNDLHYILTNAY